MENILIMNPATSENICAASVKIANDPDIKPPIISMIMKTKQIITTVNSLLNALFPCSSFFWNLISFAKMQMFQLSSSYLIPPESVKSVSLSLWMRDSISWS